MPGSPSSSTRSGAPSAMTAATASAPWRPILSASRSIKPNGTRIGKPVRPSYAGRTIASGVAPCASTSDVTVSGSTQAYRNGQSRPAEVSATAEMAARPPSTNQAIPGSRPALGRARVTGESGHGVGQARILVRRHQHDRHRTAGPGGVGHAPDGRLTVDLAESGGGVGDKDDGCDGHAGLLSRV